jgi:hypothetical protein
VVGVRCPDAAEINATEVNAAETNVPEIKATIKKPR